MNVEVDIDEHMQCRVVVHCTEKGFQLRDCLRSASRDGVGSISASQYIISAKHSTCSATNKLKSKRGRQLTSRCQDDAVKF